MGARSRLALAVVCFLLCVPARVARSGEIVYAQSVRATIGDWRDLDRLLGRPDGQFAHTASRQTTPFRRVPAGAAVWLDFGRELEAGTVTVYHSDPGGFRTYLGLSIAWSSETSAPFTPPAEAWDACNGIQGTGAVTVCFPARKFRYLELVHWTADPAIQDGIDAVAVVTGEPAGYGTYLDPAPAQAGPAICARAVQSARHWDNPRAALGPPDGSLAWTRNPTTEMPWMIVDLGRVVYSGTLDFVHAQSHPLYSGLQVLINAAETNPDPDICPEYGAAAWQVLTGGSDRSGLVRLQFPPTRFRYICFAQSQTRPGQEDGVDAVWAYESPGPDTARPGEDRR